MKMQNTLFSLLFVACGMTAFAGYDAAGGYVTLEKDEYNSGSNFKSSLTTAGWWSDRTEHPEGPHAGTNYYASGIQVYTTAGVAFKGDSLTAAKLRQWCYTWATLEANACIVNDLRLTAGGTISAFNQSRPFLYKGKLTFLGNAEIYAGKCCATNSQGQITTVYDGGWIVFKSDLVAPETATITCRQDKEETMTTPLNRTGDYFLGNNDAFLGTVKVIHSQSAILGDSGFKNAKDVRLTTAYTALGTWASKDAVIPVKQLSTVAGATIRLPISNTLEVATLNLAAGTVFDCSPAIAAGVSEGGVRVTTTLSWGGKMKLDGLAGALTRSLTSARILSAPVTVRTFSEDDFELVGIDPEDNLALKVETVGDESVVSIVKKFTLPAYPSVFDETTGYVVMTNGDGSSGNWGVKYFTASFGGEHATDAYPPGLWKDGASPSKGKKYFTNGKYIRNLTFTNFAGDQFVLNSTFRTVQVPSITAADWVLLGNGQRTVQKTPYITTSGGAWNIKLFGRMTFLTTMASPFHFSGYAFKTNSAGQVTYQQVWDIRNEWLGDEDSAVMFGREGSPWKRTTDVPKAWFNGTATNFWGTLILSTNVNVAINRDLEHATVEQHDRTDLTTAATNGATIRIKKYVVLGADPNLRGWDDPALPDWVRNVDVAPTNTLSVGSLTLTGELVKRGGGVFKVGGTATANAGAALAVEAGFIQAMSPNAFNGFALSFADQAGFVVDASAEAPLATTASVTAAGTVPVTIEGVNRTASVLTVTLAKVPAADAEAFADALAVKRPRGFTVSAPTVGAAGSDGLAPIAVTLTHTGLAIFLR